MDKLRANNIIYCREVEFEGCINPETGCGLRYDFYIPSKNLIIEYDGKDAHCKPDQRRRDRVKNKFAFDCGITIVRISGIQNIDSALNKYCQVDKVKKKKKKPIYKKPFKSSVDRGYSQKVQEMKQMSIDSPLNFYNELMTIRATNKELYQRLKQAITL